MTRPVTIGGRSGNRRTNSLRKSFVLICRWIGYPQFLTKWSRTLSASSAWLGLRELMYWTRAFVASRGLGCELTTHSLPTHVFAFFLLMYSASSMFTMSLGARSVGSQAWSGQCQWRSSVCKASDGHRGLRAARNAPTRAWTGDLLAHGRADVAGNIAAGREGKGSEAANRRCAVSCRERVERCHELGF